MEVQDGMRGRWFGCDVPAVITKQQESADRVTPAQPARAACRTDLLMRRPAPADTQDSSFAPQGRSLPRSTLTSRHRRDRKQDGGRSGR